jgi:hypothetical protein
MNCCENPTKEMALYIIINILKRQLHGKLMRESNYSSFFRLWGKAKKKSIHTIVVTLFIRYLSFFTSALLRAAHPRERFENDIP